MKKLVMTVSAVLLSTSVFAADKSDVDMSKVSYLIGRNISQELERGKVSVDKTQLIKGLESGLEGKDSKIPQKEATKIIQQFQKEMNERMAKFEKAEAKENLKLSDNFEKVVSEQSNVKEVAEGVYIQSLKEGDGKQPTKEDTITVNYRGTIPSEAYALDPKASLKTINEGNIIGEEFDSSYLRGKPVTFKLPKVIKCWQESISQLKVGSKAIIYCSPKAVYGDDNIPGVGPNQLLSFEVELLNIQDKKADKDS